jgi:phage host-nuclease inhibitor protein Gam
MHKQINSAVVIAKLLSTEGFSDHTANQVERYWKRATALTERQKAQIERMEAAIADWCKDMPADKRLLLGKFIGLHKKMAFDTGIRIGLTCCAVKNAEGVTLP